MIRRGHIGVRLLDRIGFRVLAVLCVKNISFFYCRFALHASKPLSPFIYVNNRTLFTTKSVQTEEFNVSMDQFQQNVHRIGLSDNTEIGDAILTLELTLIQVRSVA